MSITITTLPKEDTTAQTFVLQYGDSKEKKWYNSTSSTSAFKQEVSVAHSKVGNVKGTNTPIIRSLVKSRTFKIIDPAAPGGTEEITVNLTLTRPQLLSELTTTDVKDTVSYLRSLVTASVVTQLLNMEL